MGKNVTTGLKSRARKGQGEDRHRWTSPRRAARRLPAGERRRDWGAAPGRHPPSELCRESSGPAWILGGRHLKSSTETSSQSPARHAVAPRAAESRPKRGRQGGGDPERQCGGNKFKCEQWPLQWGPGPSPRENQPRPPQKFSVSPPKRWKVLEITTGGPVARSGILG